MVGRYLLNNIYHHTYLLESTLISSCGVWTCAPIFNRMKCRFNADLLYYSCLFWKKCITCKNCTTSIVGGLVVKVRNMKMDFNTRGTWRRVGQGTLMMKIYEKIFQLCRLVALYNNIKKSSRRRKIFYTRQLNDSAE